MRLPTLTRKQLLIIAGGGVAIIIVLFMFGLNPEPPKKPAHLEIWGVYDELGAFREIIDAYQKENKHISISYIKKSFLDYEKELVNAFAGDSGPDIWLMHNTWLPKHKDKIKETPVGDEFLSFNTFRETFVDVVEKDLGEDNKIYGIPLYVDTLALFYNKDLLNSAGISSPPETWEDFVDDLDKLVKKNKWGRIEQAGAALGTAENVNRSTDILALLMLQNGTKMVSEDKKTATFDRSIYIGEESYYPGRDALRFYTDFSNPSKTVYTWNRQISYSVDAFVEGEVAIMFNYSHHIPTIKARAPYLNFGVAAMPQLKDRNFDVNYANYWAFTVSKKIDSYVANEAWKFIIYLSRKENVQKYLENAKRPTARRDLVDWQKDDLDLGVFAKQSLSAQSWYQVNSNDIETILAEAIESVVLGKDTVDGVISKAAAQVSLLMKE